MLCLWSEFIACLKRKIAEKKKLQLRLRLVCLLSPPHPPALILGMLFRSFRCSVPQIEMGLTVLRYSCSFNDLGVEMTRNRVQLGCLVGEFWREMVRCWILGFLKLLWISKVILHFCNSYDFVFDFACN